MKVRLVFDNWLGPPSSGFPMLVGVYHTEKGVELSSHDFHSGTTFWGSIDLDEDSAAELQEALADGYHPVFYVVKDADTRRE